MLTVYILSPGGTHPCPSQSTSFWTTSCCTTNRLLTSCSVCVCVICWFMYWVDLVTMEMVAWWLEVTQYVLLNIHIILYLVTNCYRIFFFLNDSWIRNNKWSWLLYSLCWLFFYMTEASMVFCVSMKMKSWPYIRQFYQSFIWLECILMVFLEKREISCLPLLWFHWYLMSTNFSGFWCRVDPQNWSMIWYLLYNI